MGAVTPSATLRESVGSVLLHIFTFAATTDDGDTYASGISDVVGCWGNCTDDSTGADYNGVDITESSGTFTFRLGEDDRSLMLYVLSEQ